MIIQSQRTGLGHGESVHLTLNDTAAVALTKATTELQLKVSADLRKKPSIQPEKEEAEESDRKTSEQRAKEARPDVDIARDALPARRDTGQGRKLDINV